MFKRRLDGETKQWVACVCVCVCVCVFHCRFVIM